MLSMSKKKSDGNQMHETPNMFDHLQFNKTYHSSPEFCIAEALVRSMTESTFIGALVKCYRFKIESANTRAPLCRLEIFCWVARSTSSLSSDCRQGRGSCGTFLPPQRSSNLCLRAEFPWWARIPHSEASTLQMHLCGCRTAVRHTAKFLWKQSLAPKYRPPLKTFVFSKQHIHRLF